MKVAIVGSREYHDLRAVIHYVESLPKGTIVVSGGARGVDQAAEFAAKRCFLGVESIRPVWKIGGVYHPEAGFTRNVDIIRAADRVTAFWDGRSRGTAHSMRLAVESMKPLLVVFPATFERQKIPVTLQEVGIDLGYLGCWTTSDTL